MKGHQTFHPMLLEATPFLVKKIFIHHTGRSKLVRIPQASLIITKKTELECSGIFLNKTSQLGKCLFNLSYKYAFHSFS